MSISLACGTKTHTMSERGMDCYETPPEAVEALLNVESLSGDVWEPACGPGSIVQTLRYRGITVHASDVIDYGCADSQCGIKWNFLAQQRALAPTIVTNPPFGEAEDFVTHGLRLCSKVIMLLRLSFLESERRRRILESGELARVYPFRNRLPMMHRQGWTGNKAGNAMAFAWFVWERGRKGPTELQRISWTAAGSQ